METVRDLILFSSTITADCDCNHEIKRLLLLGRKAMTNLDSILKSRDSKKKKKSRDITLSRKVHLIKAMVFHVWVWELVYKESWAPKNWCFWTVVLEKTPESPLNCKEIQPVHPEGNQFWIFIGKTDAEAEVQLLWPPDDKNWLTERNTDAWKDRRQEWDGWMASTTRWTWVWVSSRSWW